MKALTVCLSMLIMRAANLFQKESILSNVLRTSQRIHYRHSARYTKRMLAGIKA